ncbi:hypothetical protein K505DRAFT_326094 [Melanomma pulvis-pyrius CBS 109.77]|uniref:Uncharacterized protein n=1 Tax=Melanomma pulvis-pyrius CBS 109.77 TaxID=1314802 RepID=A0A6A6X8C3_9PLEO|nr:hypothetical protein K505DRAFT_326094 [Melanomma pulvis-pyrius CBS 109.77]
MHLKHKSTSNRLSKIFKSGSKKSDGVPRLPTPPPGDIPTSRTKNQKATKEEIRDLRELIRYRYALDVEIWNLRDVQDFNRDVVREKMRKSTAALGKIKRIVDNLDDRSYFSSDAEYEKLRQIKFRVSEGGKRDWDRNPPWEEHEEDVARPMRYDYSVTGAVSMVRPFELDSVSSHGTVSFVSSSTLS